MGYNYKQIAESVVKCIGGQKNIKSVQHCATRLRLIVVDREAIDEKGIGNIEGVKGTFFTAGQFHKFVCSILVPVLIPRRNISIATSIN